MINALINFIIWIKKLNSNVDHNIYQLIIIHKVEVGSYRTEWNGGLEVHYFTITIKGNIMAIPWSMLTQASHGLLGASP